MPAPALTPGSGRRPRLAAYLLGTFVLIAGFVWLALKDLAPNPFHPHGYCYLWEPSIVGLLVVSDLSIWLSYVAIAVALAWFVLRGRRVIPFQWVFLAFGGFIVACGFTHFMDVVTLYKTTFWLAADVKLLTAIASVATAIAVPPLVPKVVALIETARISEQRKDKLERAMRAATRAARTARAEESRFRTLFEASPDGLITVAPDGRIHLVNATAEKLFGYDRAELVGQPIEVLVPPQHRADHVSYRDNFNQHPRMRPMGAGLSLEASRKDGSTFPVEISLSPMTSPEGEPSVVAVVRDITERRNAEEQAALLEREKDARAEAEAANRAKDEFLSVMSHELRTPLNAILGWAVMMKSRSLDHAAVARGLEVIERNAQAQKQVIDDLLDISLIVAGKITLNREPVDINDVVSSAVDSIRPSADGKEVKIETVTAARMPSVMGDGRRLQQVFWNLLSNAVKFTPSGGRVTIVTTTADSNVRVEVADTGIGIDASFLPNVFDRFRQLDSSTRRQYGGLGLGLALVRDIVAAHGGQVEVRSEGAGKGTVFTVTLPATALD